MDDSRVFQQRISNKKLSKMMVDFENRSQVEWWSVYSAVPRLIALVTRTSTIVIYDILYSTKYKNKTFVYSLGLGNLRLQLNIYFILSRRYQCVLTLASIIIIYLSVTVNHTFVFIVCSGWPNEMHACIFCLLLSVDFIGIISAMYRDFRLAM